MGKLTALSVKAAKKPGRYNDGDGLMLLVKPSGTRSWLLRMQVHGHRRDFGLGSAAQIGLSEARERAFQTRKQFQSGIDPVAAKRTLQAARASIPTFREAATVAHGERKGAWRNDKHQAQWLSSLRTYVFPTIGEMPVDKIEAPMIRDLLAQIWLSKPETARRVRQRIGAVLDWAHSKGFRLTEAPMRSIGRGLPRQPKKDRHFAALPYDELPSLINRLQLSESVGRLALQFLILTAARTGEVRGATWDEINLDEAIWTVPASRMKAGREHIVPLSKAALSVLAKAQSLRALASGGPIFPGARGKGLSDMTISKALRSAIVGKATVHGLRSSFRDWAAERTIIAGDVVEAALAHTIPNKVEAAYRRTNYLEKRKGLMEDWARYLTAKRQ